MNIVNKEDIEHLIGIDVLFGTITDKYGHPPNWTRPHGDLVLEELQTLSEPEIRINLTKIKGIGDWTTDIYLMFCLQSKDIFPVGDIAVVNTVKELTDSKTKTEILLLAEKWRPYRSLATYFLWHYYLSKRNSSYNKQANPEINN